MIGLGLGHQAYKKGRRELMNLWERIEAAMAVPRIVRGLKVSVAVENLKLGFKINNKAMR